MKTLRKTTVLIADSHIVGDTKEAVDFFAMLDLIASREPAAVFFLGDIFELWIALKGYETPAHLRFVEWCAAHKREFEIGFIEGNHEYFISESRGAAFTWCDSLRHVSKSGLVFVHGDTVNRSDWRYLFMRFIARNFFTKLIMRFLAKRLGPALADKIRLRLKSTNLSNKKFLPYAHIDSYCLEMSAAEPGIVVSGHFHEAGRIETKSGRVLNILPAWAGSHGFALLGESGEMELVRYDRESGIVRNI